MRYLAAFDPRKIAYSKGQCHMSISKMNNVRINVGKIAYSKTGWIALLVSSGLAYNDCHALAGFGPISRLFQWN